VAAGDREKCHSTALKQQQATRILCRYRKNTMPGWLRHDRDNARSGRRLDPPDDERTLERLMSALPEEHREVLVLREIEDLDYREIAAVTNIPIGTVMSRLARARAALKARWLKEAEGERRGVR